MRPVLFLLFILGISNSAHGQAFKGEATLSKIEADGFYRVFISPKISPYFNADFSNIRIYDQQNRQVPYLFQKEELAYHSEKFKTYEIVENKQEKDCCTSLILRNPDNRPINNISLTIKNAEVTKQATLLGSDDKENWFALKQHFALYAIDNRDRTTEIKIVDFPLSNYTYYLLQLEDSTTAPIKILNAGYFEINTEDGKYSEVNPRHIVKSDSVKEKRSYVNVTFDTAQVLDKVTIAMTGPVYFLRKASLYAIDRRINKKGKKEKYRELIYDFELSSKQPSVIALPGVKVSQLLMVIENEDNPSLELASLKAFQLNRYLTVWLKKGTQYSMKIGGGDLTPPTYDLAFFTDKIPEQVPILSVGAVTLFKEKGVPSTKTFFTNQSIVWIAIILVMVILGMMSLRLIKETGKTKNAD